MTLRIWLKSLPDGGYRVRLDPGGDRTDVLVTVRSASGVAAFDGVWLNGARSYDTYVLIDGVKAYHAPPQGLSDRSFEIHEANGGGHSP